MSRRIEVELTSDRGDGTFTWRAAGAKEPKGVLDAGLLPSGVAVGDKVKADADYDMEGVTIVAVLPPTEKKKAENVIEFLGAPPPPPRDYSKEPERRDRKPRKGRDRKGGGPRGERPDRPRHDRPEKPKLPPKPKAPRLRAGRKHRQALLADLPEEQRPVAEQVLKGGIPAVRAAIDEQNAAAKEAGQPPVKADALLGLAESLVPRARVAEWRDRAEAAIEQVDTVDLRDLRSVVTKAETAAKDEETRALAERLREGLAARLAKEQAAWLAEIAELLADDRVVRALNVSSRPPKAGTPLPRDLAERLATAAGAALTDQIGSKRWSTVLEALALSPVHAQVEPASVPANPNDELVAAVTKVSMQVPQIAARFGIEPKPAPRGRGGRSRSRKAGDRKPVSTPAPAKAAPRIPPPPPLESTPVAKAADAPAEAVTAEVAEAPDDAAAPAAPPEPAEAPAADAAPAAPEAVTAEVVEAPAEPTDAGEGGGEPVADAAETDAGEGGGEPAADAAAPVAEGTDSGEGGGDADAPTAAADGTDAGEGGGDEPATDAPAAAAEPEESPSS